MSGVRNPHLPPASTRSTKGDLDGWPPKVALIRAGVRFEPNRGSRSVSDNAWPGGEEAGRHGRQVHGRRRSESRGDGAELATDEIQWHGRSPMDVRRLRRDLRSGTP